VREYSPPGISDIRGNWNLTLVPTCGRELGTGGPRAEETRVGEMEGPFIAHWQHVGLSPIGWMGVDDVTLGKEGSALV